MFGSKTSFSPSITNSFGMRLGIASGSLSSQYLIASIPKSLSIFVYMLMHARYIECG